MFKLNKKILTVFMAATMSFSAFAATSSAATDYWQNWTDGGVQSMLRTEQAGITV